MGFHDQAVAHKPKITMRNVAIGLLSSGNAFSGVMNLASPSGSPTDKSEFGERYLRTLMLTVKFGGGGIMLWGCFMVQARPLSASKGKS